MIENAADDTTTSGFDRARQEFLAAGRTLWLASLGAASRLDEKGKEVFDRLVERGRPLDEKQKRAVNAWSDRASEGVREAGKAVSDAVGYEVQGVLKRVGVPTREDVETLAARLDALAKKIDEYTAGSL